MSSENGCNKTTATALQVPAVNVTGTRTVVPAKKSCALTTFDLPYITGYYNQKLLIYRTPAAYDVLSAVARMMAALADALQVFYPLSGRIRQDADGVLAIQGDEGAEVMEAETDDISIDDLVGGDYINEVERVVKLLVPYRAPLAAGPENPRVFKTPRDILH